MSHQSVNIQNVLLLVKLQKYGLSLLMLSQFYSCILKPSQRLVPQKDPGLCKHLNKN